MTRLYVTTFLFGSLFVAFGSAHGDEVVIHERPAHECSSDESVEWKLQGEQPLGTVLKEVSRLFCDTFFVERSQLTEKVTLHFKPTTDPSELQERLHSAIRAEGIDLHMNLGWDVRRIPEPARTTIEDTPPPDSYAKYIQCKGNECEVAREGLDKVLGNLSALTSQARFVPSMRGGKPNGFKMYAIRLGTLFSLLGFQNGDTIQLVNGGDLSTPDRALEVLAKLRGASRIVITGERRGALFTIGITIKG